MRDASRLSAFVIALLAVPAGAQTPGIVNGPPAPVPPES